MKNWPVIAILGSAQFVMVLDGTVMNVSISTVVEDLDTTVDAMQAAITFYTLTMAALMLLGAKLGDVWGRRRAFVIGSIVYAVGSLTTALSPNVATLFVGWSIIEGLGAVLVIPAIAALIADNYEGHARVAAYAIIGAASGAAVAAGPAHRRIHDDLPELAVRVRRRSRDHGGRRAVRSSHRRSNGCPAFADRRAERAPFGGRPGLRRLRHAAEQDVGLGHPAAPAGHRRRRGRAARGIADHLVRARRVGADLGVHRPAAAPVGRRPAAARRRRAVLDPATAQRAHGAARAVRDDRRIVLHDAGVPADDPRPRRAADRHPHLPAVDLAHPVLHPRHAARAHVVASAHHPHRAGAARARLVPAARRRRHRTAEPGIRHRNVRRGRGPRTARVADRQCQHVERRRGAVERGRWTAGRLPEPRIVARNRASSDRC